MAVHHSGVVDRIPRMQPAHAGAYAVVGVEWMLRVHSLDGSTFLHEVMSWPPS